MRSFAIVFVVAIVAGAAPVQAQEDARINEVGVLAGGYFVPTQLEVQGKDSIASGGAAFAFRYLRNVDKKVAFGVEAAFLNAGSHDSDVLVTHAMTQTTLTSTAVLGEVRVRSSEGDLRPFFIGGIGAHRTHLKMDVTPQAGFIWSDTATREVRTAVDTPKTSMAATIQGGLEYHASASVVVGAYAAWYYLAKATYDATSAGRNGGLASVSGSFSGLSLGGALSARF